MNRLLDLFSVFVMLSIAGLAEAADCRHNPTLVGPCFELHGRMFPSNGSPALRISRIGTDRVLGVWYSEEADPGPGVIDLPPNVRKLMRPTPWFPSIEGNFTLCPFTTEQPGRMQFVCVADATSLKQ
jgi:hypothetical protein